MDNPVGHDFALSVRLADPQELDLAGEVVRAAYAADGHTSQEYLDVIADARDRARDAQIAVAVDGTGQHLLGAVTFVLPGSRWAEVSRPGEAEVRMLGVRPQVRGHGVGLALIDWCVEHARRHGVHRLLLCTRPVMPQAQRLYTRRGFGRRPELDWSPAPGVELLGFGLELSLGRADPPS